MNNKFTKEYFREEIVKFRQAWGDKRNWQDPEKLSRGFQGLLYVYTNVEDLGEDEINLMIATKEEFERRAQLMLLVS